MRKLLRCMIFHRARLDSYYYLESMRGVGLYFLKLKNGRYCHMDLQMRRYRSKGSIASNAAWRPKTSLNSWKFTIAAIFQNSSFCRFVFWNGYSWFVFLNLSCGIVRLSGSFKKGTMFVLAVLVFCFLPSCMIAHSQIILRSSRSPCGFFSI